MTRWRNAPTRYPPLPALSEAFLSAAHFAARQGARWRRSAFIALVLLAAVATAASVVASFQRSDAIQQRDQAVYNQLLAESAQLGSSDTSLAAQLSLAAYHIRPTQALAQQLLEMQNTPLAAALATDAGFVSAVAFSPDRQHAGQRPVRRHRPAMGYHGSGTSPAVRPAANRWP